MQQPSGNPAAWGALLFAGLAYEAYALVTNRQDDTLSQVTRTLFRVHGKPGRVAFAAGWVGFSTWYLGHILRWWR